MNYNIYPRLISILKNTALVLLLYTLSRFIFYWIHKDLFTAFSVTEIAEAFLIGLRFDISTVFLLSVPYIVFSLMPFSFYSSRQYQNLLQIIFILCHLPIFLFHMGDIEYFKFTGARMTLGVTAMGSEIKNQLGQFIFNYWHITLLDLIGIALMICLFQKAKNTNRKSSLINYVIISTLILIITLLGIRGGLQKKVLQPSYAFTVVDDKLAILALNSSFTILKTNLRDQVKKVDYYPDWKAVYSHLEKPILTHPGKSKQNIMVIILESFATEFWGIANQGHGYTPFLDQLANKGLFFRNHFANGRRSIEAVPSILFSLPSLMDHPLAKSKYQFNTWHGLGEQLLQAGYHTSFFHAAESGSMYFDAVAALGGLEDYYPFERYPRPEDTDGHWGIFDEPYLQYVIEQTNHFKAPFFSMVFTLSSHQPYPIPPQYKDRFKKGPTPLHECIGYVDYALQRFFEEAQKQPWFKDTLFIITGDHTQMSPSVNYDTVLGRYMVPLLIYHPSETLKANTQKIVQHADILPTILDYLAIQDPKITLFGRSVWQDDEGRAIFQSNGIYYLVKKGYAVEYNSNQKTFVYYQYQDPNTALVIEPSIEVQQTLQQEVLAFIQYYNNGLIENKIYDWDK